MLFFALLTAVAAQQYGPNDYISALTQSLNQTATETTITNTQTAIHCNEICTPTVVTLTTVVPVTHTTTVCPLTIDGKTITVTVPCPIETNHTVSLNSTVTAQNATQVPVPTLPSFHENGAVVVKAGALAALPVVALMI
ncbi:hypothetical protein CJU89_3726 [Yarrowia sp. B02]|nr:hypothetical protein CJU89_3726 [Yarrowia sp. B02]